MRTIAIEEFGATLYIMDTKELEDKACFAKTYDRLSTARRAKVDEQHFMEDKRRSLGAGMLLERGLSDYGLKGEETDIACGAYGKPYLKNRPDIHFNLSHAGDRAAAVFAASAAGCDIEREKTADMAVARRFFCQTEYEYVCRQGPSEQNRAFYRLWTLKESFVKTVGLGLSLPFNAFEIQFSGGEAAVRQHVDMASYFFREYVLDEGYLLALCFRGA